MTSFAILTQIQYILKNTVRDFIAVALLTESICRDLRCPLPRNPSPLCCGLNLSPRRLLEGTDKRQARVPEVSILCIYHNILEKENSNYAVGAYLVTFRGAYLRIFHSDKTVELYLHVKISHHGMALN
jgi:hypothetical protein